MFSRDFDRASLLITAIGDMMWRTDFPCFLLQITSSSRRSLHLYPYQR